MKLIMAATFIVAVAMPLAAHAVTLDELEARIDALEIELEISNDTVADTARQLEYQTKISGYVDVEFKDTTGSEPGFRLHHANFMFLKKLDEKWNFFSELEFENAPAYEAEDFEAGPAVSGEIEADGGIFMEKVGFDYKWRTAVTVRMGRFITPAGLWSEDHYTPYVVTQERPMHIRQIFPAVTDGIGVFGTVPVGGLFMSYNLYTGNGKDNGGGGDSDNDKALGLKASFVFPLLQHVEAGFSYYRDNDAADVSGQGLHLKIREGAFEMQAEYAKGEDQAKDLVGYYLQPVYNIGKWAVGLRYDLWDNDSGAVSLTEKTAQSLFVNYRVRPDIVLKAEHHVYSDEDSAVAETTTTIFTVAAFLGK